MRYKKLLRAFEQNEKFHRAETIGKVITHLTEVADHEGIVWRKQLKMSKDIGVSGASFSRALQALEKAGFIKYVLDHEFKYKVQLTDERHF